jgi:hypothetical protein
MGYPIMFYVSDENRENLRSVSNRSELVNKLLAEHFKFSAINLMTPEELAKRKAILITQIEAEKKIKEIENETTN